ncbi:hypothetical protein ABES25_05445 [Bacillus gobiensis]|uniref:hypothetical protein n=1 Tax=Bacillus gobiensis TaxID=1441095 RepID=UPI003D228480
MEFDYLRPVFITFIAILSTLSLLLIFFRGKYKSINGFSVSSISMICLSISTINICQIGIIADELNLAGDPVSFFMFLAIVVLSILNPILFSMKRKRISNFGT